MPSARPIAVIMLTMKKDSEVTWPTTEEMATVTMIDTMAMLIGMNAATRAPNTRSSTIIAAGSPNFSSPFVEVGLRELGEVVVERVHPGDVDLEVGGGVRGDDLVEHVDDPVLGVGPEHQRHHRGVPVLGDAGLVGRVGVADASAVAPVASIEDRTSATKALNSGSSPVRSAE